MRLDYDLIRDLLLTLETICNRTENYPVSYIHQNHYSNYDYFVINYYIIYLTEAGLIHFNNDYIIDLSPKGHSFLNNIRSQDIWSKTKETIKPLGTVSLDIVANIASSIVSKFFNL